MVYREGSKVGIAFADTDDIEEKRATAVRERPVGILPFFSDASVCHDSLCLRTAIDSFIVQGSAETLFYLCYIFSAYLRLLSAHLKRCV